MFPPLWCVLYYHLSPFRFSAHNSLHKCGSVAVDFFQPGVPSPTPPAYCTIVYLRFVSRPTTVSTNVAPSPSISFSLAYLPPPPRHRCRGSDSATDAKPPESCGALASSVQRDLLSLRGRQGPFHMLFETVKTCSRSQNPPFSFGTGDVRRAPPTFSICTLGSYSRALN